MTKAQKLSLRVASFVLFASLASCVEPPVNQVYEGNPKPDSEVAYLKEYTMNLWIESVDDVDVKPEGFHAHPRTVIVLPGPHIVIITSAAHERLITFEAEAGHKYYLRAGDLVSTWSSMFGNAPCAIFEIVDQDTLQPVAKLETWQPRGKKPCLGITHFPPASFSAKRYGKLIFRFALYNRIDGSEKAAHLKREISDGAGYFFKAILSSGMLFYRDAVSLESEMNPDDLYGIVRSKIIPIAMNDGVSSFSEFGGCEHDGEGFSPVWS